MSQSIESKTVRDLRRHWKPTKERLQRASSGHPLVVRMHRAFSWMDAAEDSGDREMADEKLIFRWIALNALYGRWNSVSHEPEGDGQSLQCFLTVVENMDQDSLMKRCLVDHKPVVVAICSDQFLNSVFWRILETEKRFNPNRDKYSIERLYSEQKWPLILDELVERIYLVRCQLVHGAATHGGSLNRKTVRHCGVMLNHLLFDIITIIADFGITENWDDLCYPPVSQSQSENVNSKPKPR